MRYYMQLSKGLIIKHKNVHQAKLMRYGTLLECRGLFTYEEIGLYKLVYLGKGSESDKHIADKIQRYR